jgi:hypothetical protein
LVRLGSLILTGVRLPVVMVPLPSWPLELTPQASTFPVEVRARLCPTPAAARVTLVPVGSLTLTGVALSVVVPSLSSPSPL